MKSKYQSSWQCIMWYIWTLKWQLNETVTLETLHLQSEPLLFSESPRPQCHLHLSALIQARDLQLQQDVMSWAQEQQLSGKHVFNAHLHLPTTYTKTFFFDCHLAVLKPEPTKHLEIIKISVWII